MYLLCCNRVHVVTIWWLFFHLLLSLVSLVEDYKTEYLCHLVPLRATENVSGPIMGQYRKLRRCILRRTAYNWCIKHTCDWPILDFALIILEWRNVISRLHQAYNLQTIQDGEFVGVFFFSDKKHRKMPNAIYRCKLDYSSSRNIIWNQIWIKYWE